MGTKNEEANLPAADDLFGDDGSDLDVSGDRGDEAPSETPVDTSGDTEDLTVATGDTSTSTESGEETSTTESTDSGEEASTTESTETSTETSTESGEETGEESGEQGGKPKIPKERFDEVNERRKEAERKLREMEEQGQQSETSQTEQVDFDFDNAEERYQDAVLDGDKEKAKEIRREIRQNEQKLYEQRAQQNAQQTVQQSTTKQRLQAQIVEAQAQYPELDGDSDSFNKEASDEALEMFNGLKAAGHAPDKAMEKAVSKAARLHGLKPLSERGVETSKPAAKEETEAQPADTATEEQRAKKLETAERQPPNPGTRSQDEPARDVMQLSEEEFDALDEKEKARMRGDV